MLGFITEAHLGQAEEAFPGIARFFAALSDKPRTFLELVSRFERWCDRRPGPAPEPAPPPTRA